MNTRKHDLAELEKGRDAAATKEARLHRDALLAAVYEQAKDPILEKMRIKLIDALKKGDIKAIGEIQKKVKAYASTNVFRQNLYSKIKKVSEKEARQIVDRG